MPHIIHAKRLTPPRTRLLTTAAVLSDTGINKLTDPSDPSQKAAGDALKKLRDAGGLTPGALDSLKKAADLLKSN